MGIVGHDRRRPGPLHAGPGEGVALQDVGVQLDEPGNEPVAVAVESSVGGGRARGHLGDVPALGAQRGHEAVIASDDPGVAQP